MSSNIGINISKTELILFENFWDWSGLSYNKNVKWSIDTIHQFAEKIESSPYIWDTLKEYVDDDLIEEVINDIRKNE